MLGAMWGVMLVAALGVMLVAMLGVRNGGGDPCGDAGGAPFPLPGPVNDLEKAFECQIGSYLAFPHC